MRIALALLLLLLAGCSQVTRDVMQDPQDGTSAREVLDDTVQQIVNATEPRSYTIVAFGDSLTAGPGVAEDESYPAVLERLLRERGHEASVINEGVSSESSAEALERVEDVIAHEPDIVILETGVNDILRSVPPEQTASNINAIIDRLQEEDVAVVLAGMEAFGEFQGYSIQVHTMYPGIAEAQNVTLIPFFLKGVAGNPELNLQDYVHPNAAGYRVIAEANVLPAVEQLLEGQ